MMLQAASLARSRRVRHAFFTRQGGVSEGIYQSLNGGLGSRDDPAKVGENRVRVARALGVAQLLTAYQIHSSRVVVAHMPWNGGPPRADAIVTRTAGLAIGVMTADCGPVLLADSEAGVVGAAHAGWKGVLDGIIEATVATMEQLGARRTHIVAALGPMIRQPNYEVGSEFIARFIGLDPENQVFFTSSLRSGHARFDLAGLILRELKRARMELVEDLECCTYGDESRFFSFRRASHRAEPDYGRHVNAITLMA